MKKMKKKGAFETINAGMLSFIMFVMIVVLTILLISNLKSTNLVCDSNYNDGVCYDCNNASYTIFNTSDNYCYNTSGGVGSISSTIGGTAAYNGTIDLQEAANLPPQFAQIIVIIVIIVGILGMLSFIGYGAYEKMKR